MAELPPKSPRFKSKRSKKRSGASESPVTVDPITGKRSLNANILVTPDGCWTYENETQKAIFEKLSTDSDRAVGIVAGSLIDIRLEAAIRHRLKRDREVEKSLFSVEGPLGSFSAKIDVAYLMEIIGAKARNDMHIIRDIRNKFAHNLNIEGFSSSLIRDLTIQLKLIDTHAVNNIVDVPNQFLHSVAQNSIPRLGVIDLNNKKKDPRSRFIISCSIVVLGLCFCEMYTKDPLI